MNESVRFGLARLVAERACADLEIPINALSTMEAALQEISGVDAEKIKSVLWGDVVDLSLEESEALSVTLGLHPELFGCLVRPTSLEILSHVLRSIAAEDLDSTCDQCLDLRDWIEEIPVMDTESIGQLCLDVLGHILVADDEPSAFPSISEDEETMLGVFRGLPADARARVLAYAFSERGGSVTESADAQSYIYSRMRRDYLSPLARSVFDQLARQSDGVLTARELAERLELSDARAIGQVPRSLQRSLREMRAEGYVLDEAPLQVRRRGRESVYRLSPDALRLWQAMIQAETAGLYEKAPEA
jgi:hypothetical protein